MKKNKATRMPPKEFISLARDVLLSEPFRKTRTYRHHIKGSLYEHSLKVAYLCYLNRRRAGRTDVAVLVRGALLHDFYLYDLHGDGERHRLHWFRHPRLALKNAEAYYPDLTNTERDMILHHMFPLTPPPRTRAGWLLWLYDKVAAVNDRFRRRTRPSRK